MPTATPSLEQRKQPGQRNPKIWQRALRSAEALLLIGLIGGMVAACGGTAAPASPTATATTRPSPTPTVSNASAPAYIGAVTSAITSLGQSFNKFGNDCNDKDITDTVCRNDLQAIHDATVSVQSTLDQHPAPPCLKAVDARLREAMTDFHDGVTLIQQGADSNDVSSIQAGSDMLLDGNKELTQAGVEMDKAAC